MLDGAPPAPDPAVARRLRDRLAALPVAIEAIDGHTAGVALPSYPGGPRPSSTVVVRGRGALGAGENVGWTAEGHARFLELARGSGLRGTRSIGDLSAVLRETFPEPYDRTAFEAAAIDLALRQAGTSPARVAELTPRPVRYVVSLARSTDPSAGVRPELARRPAAEFKLDVDPTWSDPTLAALARIARVVVLDWKGAGGPDDVVRFRAVFPEALHEDPADAGPTSGAAWATTLRERLSLDQALRCAADVRAAATPPAAINIKPARMGGVLEALDAIALCGDRRIGVYLGGMFEIGVGRAQLLALAALLCPDGPNDIAPLARVGEEARRPERLIARPPDEPGFA